MVLLITFLMELPTALAAAVVEELAAETEAPMAAVVLPEKQELAVLAVKG